MNVRVDMRRGCLAASLALVLLAPNACSIETSDPQAGVTTTLDDASDETAGWIEVSQSPLSPRTGAVAIWTGTEVLVVGGSQNLCPPGADCAMTKPSLRDGAAYSPNDDAWRPISPSPGSVFGEPVVGDDAVYFETSLGALSASPKQIARYRPITDAWDVITDGDLNGSWRVEALFSGRLLLNNLGGDGLVLFDPLDGSTEQLPAPPTPPMHSTHIAVVGELLYLFGTERIIGDATSRPSLRLAAVYEEQGGWRRLPDSEALGGEDVATVESLIVDSSNGSADGGEVNNWGRSYPYGASFDMASERWEPLPGDRPNGTWHLPRQIQSGGGIVTTDALWLDPIHKSWAPIPAPITPSTDAAIVWAGDRLFVWGGSSWTQPEGRPFQEGTLHNDGSYHRLP